MQGAVHGGEVESGPRRGAAGADPTSALLATAVPCKGCHADESGDLAAFQGADLGKLGQEGSGDAGSDGGRRLQALGEFPLIAMSVDDSIEACVELGDTSFEDLDQGLQVLPDARVGVLEAALLGHDHGDELAAPPCQMAHLALLPALGRSRRGADRVGEAGQDAGVHGIGLGQRTEPLPEATDPPRVHQRNGYLGCLQRFDQGALVAARGLDGDEDRAELLEPPDELADAGCTVRDAPLLCRVNHPVDGGPSRRRSRRRCPW